MTPRLRNAITQLIDTLRDDTFGQKRRIRPLLHELDEAYSEYRETLTETSARIEFLQDCLEDGMTKRDAARALVEHDPRVGAGTAESIVYIVFSGQYQKPRKRRKIKDDFGQTVPKVDIPDSVSSDEDLI